MEYTLNDLPSGEWASVRRLDIRDAMRRRLMDIGLAKDMEVKALGKSPAGGLGAYLICGAVIALREEESRRIIVSPLGRCGDER